MWYMWVCVKYIEKIQKISARLFALYILYGELVSIFLYYSLSRTVAHEKTTLALAAIGAVILAAAAIQTSQWTWKVHAFFGEKVDRRLYFGQIKADLNILCQEQHVPPKTSQTTGTHLPQVEWPI